MAKDKLVKNITTDELAVIINKGFEGQMDYMKKQFEQVATKEQFKGLNERLSVVEKDVKYIKENLDESSNLVKRVDYIENILDIPVIKK